MRHVFLKFSDIASSSRTLESAAFKDTLADDIECLMESMTAPMCFDSPVKGAGCADKAVLTAAYGVP